MTSPHLFREIERARRRRHVRKYEEPVQRDGQCDDAIDDEPVFHSQSQGRLEISRQCGKRTATASHSAPHGRSDVWEIEKMRLSFASRATGVTAYWYTAACSTPENLEGDNRIEPPVQ